MRVKTDKALAAALRRAELFAQDPEVEHLRPTTRVRGGTVRTCLTYPPDSYGLGGGGSLGWVEWRGRNVGNHAEDFRDLIDRVVDRVKDVM